MTTLEELKRLVKNMTGEDSEAENIAEAIAEINAFKEKAAQTGGS